MGKFYDGFLQLDTKWTLAANHGYFVKSSFWWFYTESWYIVFLTCFYWIILNCCESLR